MVLNMVRPQTLFFGGKSDRDAVAERPEAQPKKRGLVAAVGINTSWLLKWDAPGSAMQYDHKSKSLYVMGTSTCCIPGRTAFTLAGQRPINPAWILLSDNAKCA